MKEEKVVVKFICDNCGRESEEFFQPHSIPYEENWIYIYKFTFKVARNKRKEINDKHFCCFACIMDYIDNKINYEKDIYVRYKDKDGNYIKCPICESTDGRCERGENYGF